MYGDQEEAGVLYMEMGKEAEGIGMKCDFEIIYMYSDPLVCGHSWGLKILSV